jgi:uncharacterized protein (TIGR02117 family)
MKIKSLIKYILWFITPIFLYVLLSFVLIFFPSQKNCTDKEKTIFIYQSTAHTEILIPLPYFGQKYQKSFPQLIKNNTNGYLAFSYGDKEFMMQVPTWDKIKLDVALKSLFTNTPALLRVGYYWGIKEEECIKIKLSQKCLEQLNQSILNSFVTKDKHFQRYFDHYKEPNTFYFKAKKSYNLFHTCNSWTGDRLRDAGLGVPFITPFAQQVTYNLD